MISVMNVMALFSAISCSDVFLMYIINLVDNECVQHVFAHLRSPSRDNSSYNIFSIPLACLRKRLNKATPRIRPYIPK